jgi:hypothetical protein
MGFRFRRSFKIAPGIRINVGKRGFSTTIGRRGASVNIGPRGTYANAGIPGTGMSWREKLGGGGRSGSIGQSGSDGSSAAAGCGGCGCLSLVGAVLFVAIVGMCDGAGSSSSPTSYALTGADTPAVAPKDELYIHGALNVRSGPGRGYPIVRTLQSGDVVQLGPAESHGWARLYATGAREYVYRASDLVRSYPPSVAPQPIASEAAPSRNSAEARGYYTGPRGGCYTYSASGRKRYVDHSFCR